MIKIVHLNTEDITGGAARAAHRLHTSLRGMGQESAMYVSRRRSNDPTVFAFEPSKSLPAKLRHRYFQKSIKRSLGQYKKSRPAGYESFSHDRTVYRADMLTQLPPSDIINLHWIAGFVDYSTFFTQIPRHIPIVWSLHDMNPFTAGCHYTHTCDKYTTCCRACPQLGSKDPKDLAYQIWKRKFEVFEQLEASQLQIVALSKWMAREVKSSTLLGKFPVRVIPNSLDIDDFAPRDQIVARRTLGIPKDARVALFVASEVTNRRKGFNLLLEALEKITHIKNLHLISLGHGQPNIELDIPHTHLGSVSNDRLLSLIYSAADVHIIASIQDNLPNTMLEALACGTPVVSFCVGGIPDVIRPRINGLLAPAFDTAALGDAVEEILGDEAGRLEMATNCREIAVKEFAPKVQASRYTEMYEQLLANLG